MNFEDLKLAPAIVKAVHEQGYDAPTPIQAQAIPLVLEGHDLLAGAQTGTGKTAGFTLPLLHKLCTTDARQPGCIRALVLTPTRELAAQVEESVRAYSRHLEIKSTVVFGGVGMNPQIERIRKGVDVLVATPGRLLDLAGQNHVDLSGIEILVLDEADRMLDMGFIHDVKKVLALLPRDKQSLLFSATFSDEIRALAAGLLKDPRSVQVTPPNTTVERISQLIYPVGRNRKKDVLAHLIREGDWSQVLVFTRTKFGANRVADFLNAQGIKAMALHGNKSQTARTQALAGFKTGQLRALVATDIAARGIDIDELPHVVNYEIPNVPEDYVHRIGRTGRAGADGDAVSLVCLDEEGFMMEIERFTKQEIPVEIMPEFGPEDGEVAEPIAMGRQTLWGGAGKPPGREVMQAAAKKARKEMMERIRTKTKPAPKAAAKPAAKPAAKAQAQDKAAAEGQQSQQSQQAQAEDLQNRPLDADGNPIPKQNRNRNRSRNRNRAGGAGQRSGGNAGGTGAARPSGHGNFAGKSAAGRHTGGGNRQNQGGNKERLPMLREDAHLGTHAGISLAAPKRSGGGQPDPMRTSVDSMTQRNRPARSGFGGNAGGQRRHKSGNRGGW